MDVICMDSGIDKNEEMVMGNGEKIKSIDKNRITSREKSRKSSKDHANKENEPLVDKNLLKLDLHLDEDDDDADDNNLEQNLLESLRLDHDDDINHTELNNFIKDICGRSLTHFHRDFNEKQQNLQGPTSGQGAKFPVKDNGRRNIPELGGDVFPVYTSVQCEQAHTEAAANATNIASRNFYPSTSFDVPSTRIDDDDMPSTSRSAAVDRSDVYNKEPYLQKPIYLDEDRDEDNVLRYIKEQDGEIIIRESYSHLDFKEKHQIDQEPTLVQRLKFPVKNNSCQNITELGKDVFPVNSLEQFENAHTEAFVKALDSDLHNIFQS